MSLELVRLSDGRRGRRGSRDTTEESQLKVKEEVEQQQQQREEQKQEKEEQKQVQLQPQQRKGGKERTSQQQQRQMEDLTLKDNRQRSISMLSWKTKAPWSGKEKEQKTKGMDQTEERDSQILEQNFSIMIVSATNRLDASFSQFAVLRFDLIYF